MERVGLVAFLLVVVALGQEAPLDDVQFDAPEAPARTCRDEMCSGNGYCNSEDKCTCFVGWSGETCTTPVPCGLRVRRSWSSLHTSERALYQEAVKLLKSRGQYDIFPTIHNSALNNRYAHGNSGFLPWHRLFLWEFENALRELGERYRCITVPYWAWEVDASLDDPRRSDMWGPTPQGWGEAVPGCPTDPWYADWVPSRESCLRREFNNQRMTGESQLVNLITSEPRYGATGGFRERLEGGPHGSPHVFVGGIMSTFLSPEDPVFFLHHANVDRLWAIWQDCHDHDKIHSDDIGDATYERSSWWPTGGWIDANMPYSLFFWEDSGRFGRVRGTPRDMHSISSPRLGYRYADDDALVRLPTMQSGCTGDWAWFHTTSTSGRNMKTQGVDFGYHLGVVEDFVRSLRGKKIERKEIYTAAMIECLAERPSLLPASYVSMMFEGKTPRDFRSICWDSLHPSSAP